ncbi:MAG: zinc-binding dehydrogenase [Rikenellaceae bacterium]|nr:zinc-binding dehydrogenase [Rikenellaceae bacterium]
MIQQCRIAVFHGTSIPIEIRTESIPEPGRGELLVRNEYTTLCRSDIHTYKGTRQEKTPTILGHEIVGRIAAFGPGYRPKDERGQTLVCGDRITWGIYASDPCCEMARRGIPQKGKDLFKYGHEMLTDRCSLHGGLGEYILIRANTPVVKIAEKVPVETVSLINCSVATVAGGSRLAGDVHRKSVVIFGCGMLGLIACAMFAGKGASYVTVVDTDPERLSIAGRFGAHEALTPEELSCKRFDVALELSGAASCMERSVECLNVGGTAVWIGGTFPQNPLSLDAEKIIRNIVTIKGLHNYNTQDLCEGAAFMESNYDTFPFTELIKGGFSLSEVNEAFDYAVRENPFRVGIDLRDSGTANKFRL